jgi:hypothetical protein
VQVVSFRRSGSLLSLFVMNLARHFIRAIVISAPPLVLPAQREVRENALAWFNWFGDIELNDRWAIDFDGTVRRSDFAREPGQYLWRASVRRNLTPNVRVGFGYAGSDTHPYGKLPIAFRTPEHRVFEQLQLVGSIGRVQMQHRYRFEQRWGGRVAVVNGEESVQNWVRTNRARYLVRATVPLSGRTLDVGGWYLNLADELFMNWGANIQQNVFDQNRATVTVGRRLSTGARLELGYMELLLQKPNGRQLERNHTLMTTLTTSFAPFRRAP